MTKYTLLISIVVIFLLGCHQTNSDGEEKLPENKAELKSDTINSEYGVIPDTINGHVELSMEPNVFELSALPDKIEVIMTNNTNDTISTGVHYRIEIFDKNRWREISFPENLIFVDIGYELKPTEYRNFEKNLFRDWIFYSKGRYRIAKWYTKPDFKRTRKEHKTYVEFNIE